MLLVSEVGFPFSFSWHNRIVFDACSIKSLLMALVKKISQIKLSVHIIKSYEPISDKSLQ